MRNFTVGKGDGIKLSVELVIPRRRVAELLVSAVEGGICYWCPRQEFKYTEPEKWEPVLDDGDENPKNWPCYDYPLLPGGAVTFIVDEQECVLNLDTVATGLRVMADKYQRHFLGFLTGGDDAETGDVFVQCCVFGEVIYG